jgi:outer membrane protein TolC
LAPQGSDFGVQQARHDDVESSTAPRVAPEQPADDRYPIDLATALRLAGASNLQIALAAERVRQAQARLQGAEVLWLPSLNAGVGLTKHDGRLQDTQGTVLDAGRSAFFVGGGPNVGPAPLTGPGGPPARLFLGLPLGDVLFAPLAERQLVRAARAGYTSTFNDTLLQAVLAYLDLLGAQGQVAIAREAVTNAEKLVNLIESRVRAGTAPPADERRAQADLADRRRQLLQAEENVRTASAELTRLLRLDPAVTLFPGEDQPAPLDLVEADVPLTELLSQGLSSRPELAEFQAVVRATLARLRQEHWRPWLPTLQVGFSAGGFGGGEGSHLGSFGDRLDFDALAVWELRNLGLGNRALQRDRASQHRQAHLNAEQLADVIAAEIARAYHQVRSRRQQIEAARVQVKAAAEALPLNFKGILGLQLRAIEAQQAVQALAAARSQYLAAILDYNRAQFQLLRAIGRPLDSPPCAD